MSEHNVVVLRGTLVGEPTTRELSSGHVVLQFDITTRDEAGAQSVPVAWFDPPAAGLDLAPGTEVVVLGSVRRRFFRSGGATQSRTEVVAERAVAARRSREVRKMLTAASALLDGAAEPQPVAGLR